MLRTLIISCLLLGSGSVGVIIALASNAVTAARDPKPFALPVEISRASFTPEAILSPVAFVPQDRVAEIPAPISMPLPEPVADKTAEPKNDRPPLDLAPPIVDFAQRFELPSAGVILNEVETDIDQEPDQISLLIREPDLETNTSSVAITAGQSSVSPFSLRATELAIEAAAQQATSSVDAITIAPDIKQAVQPSPPAQVPQTLIDIPPLATEVSQAISIETLVQEAEKPVQLASAVVETSKFASGRHLTSIMPGKKTTATYGPHHVNNRRYCALTFDDGPDPINDAKILNVLRNEGIKATFFVLGRGVRSNKQLIRRMISEGHEVANHSWSHPQLTKQPLSAVKSQLRRTNSALAELGIYPTVFRPPYGAQGSKIRKVARDMGMETMLWDVDSLDWKIKTGDRIRKKINAQSSYSSVVLMHSHTRSLPKALPGIIRDLRNKGCQFVTSTEWINGLYGSGAIQAAKPRASSSPSALTSNRIIEQPRQSAPRAQRESSSPQPQQPSTQQNFIVY